MDQRTETRKPVTLDAVVTYTRFGMLRGQITDFGLGGLYVKVDARTIPLGADISVTFRPNDVLDWVTLSGRVCHVSLNGLGLRLDALDPPVAAWLRRVPPFPNDRTREASGPRLDVA